MPSVDNPTDADLIVPTSYSPGPDKIPNYRRLKPGKSIKVSEDALPTCIRMGCVDKSQPNKAAADESPAEEEPSAEEESPAEEAPAEEEKAEEKPVTKRGRK